MCVPVLLFVTLTPPPADCDGPILVKHTLNPPVHYSDAYTICGNVCIESIVFEMNSSLGDINAKIYVPFKLFSVRKCCQKLFFLENS